MLSPVVPHLISKVSDSGVHFPLSHSSQREPGKGQGCPVTTQGRHITAPFFSPTLPAKSDVHNLHSVSKTHTTSQAVKNDLPELIEWGIPAALLVSFTTGRRGTVQTVLNVSMAFAEAA